MVQFDELKLGALILIPQKEGIASPLPLEHTAVNGTITGPVANVTVTQRFGNPFQHPIELEYLFPLPEKGAVVNYEITIGTRTIKADIKEREAARQVYQQAVQQGKRASLLEQRRPNLFSIAIGNVQPGEKITTTLTYEDRLHYSDGSYEFVFPMGITPKYHTPGTAQAESDKVDAPVELNDNNISKVEIALQVDAGVPAGEPVSRTHSITIKRKNKKQFSLTLDGDHIPNKDFVLSYPVAEKHLQTAVWSSHDDDGSDTVLVTLLPPKLDITADPPAREFIFVIDRSGSMSTHPMNQAKNALRACLRALGEHDTFTIEAFDTQNEWFAPKPLSVTQEHVNQADAWIEQIYARGGTEILRALQEALAIPVDKERQRYLVFLTDGAVSAEEQVLREVAAKRGNARLFSFGIGPSVNRYFLNKMAEIGRGTADFMGANDDIEGVMTRFQDKVSYPALLDVSVTWQGAETWDSYPDVLPDVYAGEPLELSTRLARQGNVTLNVSGKRNGEAVTMNIDIPQADASNPTLKRIWARARVESLQDSMTRGGDTEKIRQQIISLGLAHRLVTNYTSFVAVDSEVTESTQDSQKVNVSVPLPDGLDPAGFGLPTDRVLYYAMSMPAPASPPQANVFTRTVKSLDAIANVDDAEIASLAQQIRDAVDREDARLEIASMKLGEEIEESLGGGMVESQLEERRRLLGEDKKSSKGGGIVSRLVGSAKSLLGGDGEKKKQDKSSREVDNSRVSMPDFDSMSPEEMMKWMESLAKRQGAAAGMTTADDALAMMKGTAATLKRKYEEFKRGAEQADETEDELKDIDELPVALNTKKELMQEYYEQWQTQEKLIQELERAKAEPPVSFPTIEERIKWLARTQNVNGSWRDDAEMTAAALLAFVRAGHTHRTGNYRRQIAKTANWLASWTLQEAGKFAGFVPFVVVRALDELNKAAGDYAVPDSVRHALPHPASDSENAAMGVGTTPSVIHTLDELRVAALLEGAASVPDTLTQGVDSHLVQAWLAVGKLS
jgi:Ca-activated chloride channel homolog